MKLLSTEHAAVGQPSDHSLTLGTLAHAHCYWPVPEEAFLQILCLERKRAERSRKPFLLMLLDFEDLFRAAGGVRMLQQTAWALRSITREIDVRGWYKTSSVIGIILTEVKSIETDSVPEAVLPRIRAVLPGIFDPSQIEKIHVSFHTFPEGPNENPHARPNAALYPDLLGQKNFSRVVKRAMDMVASLALLLLCSPLFVLIALAIKVTSKGPILFRQKRVGQYGILFTFFKFRSMRPVSDDQAHKDYMKRFISGEVASGTGTDQGAVYKVQDDPRVTSVGKFLRKTSLDELPQLWNVLKGEMSLVGPRPPIPYEVQSYDVWHKRRVLEAKPGITGLWQVNGRSRTKFDDMVRLDLRYARTWSLWLDIKILLRTPRAVLSGDGAY